MSRHAVNILAFVLALSLPVWVLVPMALWRAHQGVESSISYSLRWVAQEAPFFAFALGLLLGLTVGACAAHFWWPIPEK